ncbi:MAG TPA: DUF2911 domain-containing protein [Acidobacteriaceae bacterium]
MKTMFRNTLLSTAVLALFGTTAAAHAQAKPMPSPPATATATVGGHAITIKYNSPSMRGRKIMGELVPYGQPWRTGANPATTLITTTDLTIGSIKVPAGTYTLYTLPAPAGTPWKLIINKQTGQWGTEYHEDQDLGRTDMISSVLPVPQEAMSISFERTAKYSTWLHIRWENTDVKVSVLDVKEGPRLGGVVTK